MPATNAPASVLNRYLLLTYAVVLANTFGYVATTPLNELRSIAFIIPVWLTYGLFYLLPVWLPARLLLIGRRRALLRLAAAWALLSATLLQLCLRADLTIFTLYRFHLNGFVWNLVTTPGGIDSLGGGSNTQVTVALLVVAVLALQTILGLVALRADWLTRLARGLHRSRRLIIALLVGLMLMERANYGFAYIQSYSPVLDGAAAFPVYMRTKFTTLAARFGVVAKKRAELKVSESTTLKYPLAPLKYHAPQRPLNIVWLVSESLRADMLTPEIMPNLWRFAQDQGIRYTQHFSGGNGTRVGVFGMFYGLYGNYWFPMQANRRGPVLVDRLKALDYQFLVQTSVRFTYPEFDMTVWAELPKALLHEEHNGENWQRDRTNVGRLLNFVDQRDTRRPFFAFQFFESPHAKYYFPNDTVIREPYLPDMNYATMDVKRDIELIRNRYINAVHHLDQQFGRILDGLAERGLLDDTLIVLTGDHGEEFMERGFWGHNSVFNRFQTQVPLVLHVPGRAPAVVDRLTSHLDLPATVLPLLGLENPAEDYSQGESLLDGPARRYTVFADWNRVAYRDARHTMTFPLDAGGSVQNKVLDADDQPVVDAEAAIQQDPSVLPTLLQGMTRFQAKH